jgi:1-acyl-sn-glycerol-3-phosphate acyltransferase
MTRPPDRQTIADWLRDLDPINLWATKTKREIRREPFRRDIDFLRRLLPRMELLSSYFGAEVHGIENVPRKGPVLLVGNHSGGSLTPDTTAFFAAWYRERGLHSPLIGLALDAAFGIPGFGDLMRKIGEVPASRKNAARALDAGLPVLVYPGGDHEVFRPWTERDRVDFGGRKGFIELALQKQVPLVPVVSHGGHASILILTRGEWIGHLLGTERVRVNAFPIALQFPWGLSPATLPGIPLPAKITIQVLPPMQWKYGPEAADDPALVQRLYKQVTSRMQRTLDRLAAENPYPVLSRLASLLFSADGDGAAPTTPKRRARRRPPRRRGESKQRRPRDTATRRSNAAQRKRS